MPISTAALFFALPAFILVFANSPISAKTRLLCEPAGASLIKPRSSADPIPSVHAAPAKIRDGWEVSTLVQQHIQPTPIEELLEYIKEHRYTKIDSILIARNGKLVFETYFNGFTRETKHDTRSAFKSVTSTLVGIAWDQRLIKDLKEPIAPYLVEDWPTPTIRNDIILKEKITIENLLTMSAGFDAEENWGIGPDREGPMFRSKDWVKYTLDLPMSTNPGSHFSYNSSTTFLLGEVLSRISGHSLPAFAKTNLFRPLGISEYCWTLTEMGRAVAQGNFYIRPRDMLKFGQLFLDGGVWRGKNILSKNWIDRATRFHYNAKRDNTDNKISSKNGYGYQWWTFKDENGGTSTSDMYQASGNGGQKIIIYPALELVVVFTGSHYGKSIGHRQPREILKRFILPAVRSNPMSP